VRVTLAMGLAGGVTVGSGTATADGFGDGPGHALPYAAGGSVFRA
jgi:hypothetical protein